jgi:predicted DNA-binding transcriptional regulator YafY
MHLSRLQRLEFIQNLLREGQQPTFEELKTVISEKLSPIKTRMLREDLHFLRTEGLNNNRLSIKLIEGKYILQNDNDFSIHSLKDNERGTLPLLFSILKPYEQFPAVSALLTNLIQVHKLNDAEIKQLSWGMGKSAQNLKPMQIQRIIDILGCIHKQVAIEFNYYKVTEGAVENSDENIVYRQVYPFQVRTFDDRYYLVGIQVGREIRAENIQHFPIDRIHRRVDIAIDETTEEPLSFDWMKFLKQTDFGNHYKHCIGMYREFGKEAQPITVYRWFTGWAASQVQAVPIHPSQQIVQKSGGDIRIQLHVYNTPDLQNVFRKFGEFCWE